MMTIEEIQAGLHNHNMTKVAQEAGVDRTTLSAILRDKNHDPRYRTVKKLSDYLTARRVVG